MTQSKITFNQILNAWDFSLRYNKSIYKKNKVKKGILIDKNHPKKT